MCELHDDATFFDEVTIRCLKDRDEAWIEVEMPLSFIIQANLSLLEWNVI